jgi:DNA-binding transcriptional ArsR family regulator
MADKAEKLTVEKVFAATSRTPSIIAAIATEAGVSADSASRWLRRLEEAGAVSRNPDGYWVRITGVRKVPAVLMEQVQRKPKAPAASAPTPSKRAAKARRATGKTTITDKATGDTFEAEAPLAGNGAQSDPDASSVVPGPWGEAGTVDAPEGSVDAVLADMQNSRPVSAPPDSNGRAKRAPGQARVATTDRSERMQAGQLWRPGQLSAVVAKLLQEHPGSTVAELSQLINDDGATPPVGHGSVGYALDALVRSGAATWQGERPRRAYPKAA